MNDLTGIPKQIAKFLRRYHFVLFVVLVVGSMSVVVLLINQSLESSIDTSSIAPQSTPALDQKTIDRVKALQPSANQQPLDLPKNQRTNPFVE